MELRRGIIKAFDPASYTATVQVVGSLGNWLAGVPVAKHLAAGLLNPGSRCGIIFFDPTNPQDACLAFVYEGAPGAWVSDAMLEGSIAGSKVVAATTTARGTVELATDGEVAVGLAVQANDARLSDARVPSAHDATKHIDRTRSIWIPADQFQIAYNTPSLVSYGAAVADYTKAWAFDQTIGEGVGSSLVLPSDWAGGAITVKFYWAADTDTNIAHACRWYAVWASLANGESVDQAREVNLIVNVVVPSATARIMGIATIGSTSTGLAAGSLIRLLVGRDAPHAGDTMTGDGLLLGVLIEYSADM